MRLPTRWTFFEAARCTEGSTALVFAIALVPLFVAAGAAIDYIRVAQQRDAVQQTGDAAILGIARDYDTKAAPATRNDEVDRLIAANAEGRDIDRVGDVRFDSTEGEVCIDVASALPMTFAGVIGISAVDVRSTSCANVFSSPDYEVALVLDVSSSMIEEDRFEPMQVAVTGFLDSFDKDAALRKHARVALVPFSSRVNIGMTHTNWLTAYDGNPAIPVRWSNPKGTYGKYDELTWVDGVTHGYGNKKNLYWLGCIEPRSDVSLERTGSVAALALSDAAPAAAPFVAMDSNDGSGRSFCPAPIVPLKQDFSYLKNAAQKLTSQGSTRLDAGAVAGWYVLSPKWKGLWGDAATPSADKDTVKVMVFMTDGQMNTQHGQAEKHMDWRCNKNKSESCNDEAIGDFLRICASMRDTGIIIYAVSYGEEADMENLRSCAGDPGRFFTAKASTTGADSIVAVYDTIARSVKETHLRLSR